MTTIPWRKTTTIPYVFRALRVHRVIDGDTLIVEIDCGFHLSTKQYVRLQGIDCPEMVGVSSEEKEAALQAKEVVEAWVAEAFSAGWPVYIRTAKDVDNFGRWLGELWSDSGYMKTLLAELLDRSLAVVSTKEHPTKWRDIYLTGN